MKQLSNRVASIPGALSIYINEVVYEMKRKGFDVISLSLGEAFFDIPMYDFSDLDFVRGYHYSDSSGLPALKEKISKYYLEKYGVETCPKSEILISAGSKVIIYMAMLAILNDGDEVLIHEPAWLSYQEQINLVDAKPAFIPFDTPIQDFQNFFHKKTKMLVINNPNNPAGRIYSKLELTKLIKLCEENNAWLLVDEAYSDFVLNHEFISALSIDKSKSNVIVVNSLSKNMGMSGWRIGYVLACKALIQEMLKLNQHIITCAPTILQQYLSRYFDDIIAVTLPQALDLIHKRKRVAKLMAEHGIEYLQGGGTFYFFISMKNYPFGSFDLALYLLLVHNIALVPGIAYGESTDNFLRLSIGTESEERIAQALMVIKNVLENPINAKEIVEKKLSSLGLREFT